MMRTPEEERIFHALSQMKTPEYDLSGIIEQAGSHRRARLRPGRPLAVAAVLCTLLTIGAAAVGISGAWRYFAPSLPQNAVETVGVSQTAGEYTLTVEEAVVDDSNIMLLLALRRADGGEFPEDTVWYNDAANLQLSVDGQQFGGFPTSQLSADRKTLYLCYDSFGYSPIDDSLLGKPLTLTVDCVAVGVPEDDPIREGEDAPAPLAPLAEYVPDFSELLENGFTYTASKRAVEQGIALPLPLAEQFPIFTIQYAAMTEYGLELAVSTGTCAYGDLVCTGVSCDAVVDTRTGDRYYDTGGGSSSGVDTKRIFFDGYPIAPIAEEDIPYLEAEVSYDIGRVLSDEPFSLTFTVEESSGLTIPMEGTITLDDTVYHPVEARLSALELRIYFNDPGIDRYDFCGFEDEITPVIHLADGTEIPTRYHMRVNSHGFYGYGPYPSVSFRAVDEVAEGERVFFNPGQVVSITFGNLEIPVEH